MIRLANFSPAKICRFLHLDRRDRPSGLAHLYLCIAMLVLGHVADAAPLTTTDAKPDHPAQPGVTIVHSPAQPPENTIIPHQNPNNIGGTWPRIGPPAPDTPSTKEVRRQYDATVRAFLRRISNTAPVGYMAHRKTPGGRTSSVHGGVDQAAPDGRRAAAQRVAADAASRLPKRATSKRLEGSPTPPGMFRNRKGNSHSCMRECLTQQSLRYFQCRNICYDVGIGRK